MIGLQTLECESRLSLAVACPVDFVSNDRSPLYLGKLWNESHSIPMHKEDIALPPLDLPDKVLSILSVDSHQLYVRLLHGILLLPRVERVERRNDQSRLLLLGIIPTLVKLNGNVGLTST